MSPPYRFSKTAFEKYEVHIAKIVDAFPKAVTFTPATHGVSTDTFSHRLRDAFHAGLLYKYKSSLINAKRYLEVGDALVVRERTDGTVVAGGLTETLTLRPAPPGEVSRSTLTAPSIERLRQLVQLMTEGVSNLREIRVTGVTRDFLAPLEKEFDVAIVEQGDTFTIL